jgi:hypothetical protein
MPYKVLAIDLAERYSGAVLLTTSGTVSACHLLDVGPNKMRVFKGGIRSEDWMDKSHALESFLNQCFASTAFDSLNTAWVIENIPPHMLNGYPAMRLQGAITFYLEHNFKVTPFLMNASTWQKGMGYVRKKGTSPKGWAKEKCEELGFEMPDDIHGKALTDLRDAFLMAHFFQDYWPNLELEA